MQSKWHRVPLLTDYVIVRKISENFSLSLLPTILIEIIHILPLCMDLTFKIPKAWNNSWKFSLPNIQPDAFLQLFNATTKFL